MNKLFYMLLMLIWLFIGRQHIYAQATPSFYDHTGAISFGGGTSIPGVALKSGGPDGLFAQNGHQVNFDFTYTFYKGLGAGAHFDFVRFRFDERQFASYAQPQS